MALEEGKKAPDFKLNDADGKPHKLSDYAGQPVVLYFYPRDNTPGCTQEACDFRDSAARLKKAKAVVLGVSPDNAKSHQKFIEKQALNFTLLCDEEHAVAEKYGAWGEKVLYGKRSMGLIRSTFLIGPDGKLARAWRKVKVNGHVDEVLEALSELKG